MSKENPLVSENEWEFIDKHWEGNIFVPFGILYKMRKLELTLNEVFEEAMAQPSQEDHYDSYRQAKIFFERNSAFFNIQVENGE